MRVREVGHNLVMISNRNFTNILTQTDAQKLVYELNMFFGKKLEKEHEKKRSLDEEFYDEVYKLREEDDE